MYLQSYKENLMSSGEMVTYQIYEEGLWFSMSHGLCDLCIYNLKPWNLNPKLNSKENHLTKAST